MMQLDVRAPAVHTPVAHDQQAQLHQAPRDLADDRAAGIALVVAPAPLPLELAFPLARPTPLATAAARLPRQLSLPLAVRRSARAAACAELRGILGVIPPTVGLAARLAL